MAFQINVVAVNDYSDGVQVNRWGKEVGRGRDKGEGEKGRRESTTGRSTINCKFPYALPPLVVGKSFQLSSW